MKLIRDETRQEAKRQPEEAGFVAYVEPGMQSEACAQPLLIGRKNLIR